MLIYFWDKTYQFRSRFCKETAEQLLLVKDAFEIQILALSKYFLSRISNWKFFDLKLSYFTGTLDWLFNLFAAISTLTIGFWTKKFLRNLQTKKYSPQFQRIENRLFSKYPILLTLLVTIQWILFNE